MELYGTAPMRGHGRAGATCAVAVVATVVGACGRIDFAPLGDAAGGSARRCDWSSGPRLGTPERVAELSTPEDDIGVFIAPDRLTAYVSRSAPPAPEYRETISRAVRTAPDLPFGALEPASEISNTGGGGHVTMSSDGLEFYWHSTRPGGPGGSDIWRGRRTSVELPFDTVEPVLTLDTPRDEWDPHLFRGDSMIAFGGTCEGEFGICTASRASPDEPFTGLTMLVYGGGDDIDGASLTEDGLVLLYHIATMGTHRIWYATRNDPAQPFPPAQELTVVNSAGNSWKPFVTADGCEVYLSSDRSGADFDVYRATFVP